MSVSGQLENIEVLEFEATDTGSMEGKLNQAGDIVPPGVIKEEVKKHFDEEYADKLNKIPTNFDVGRPINQNNAATVAMFDCVDDEVDSFTISGKGAVSVSVGTNDNEVVVGVEPEQATGNSETAVMSQKAVTESLESFASNKLGVDDIINNLTTDVSNKPLSAAQGVVLKKEIQETEQLLANSEIVESVSDIQSIMGSDIVGIKIKIKGGKEYELVGLNADGKVYAGFLPEPLIKSINVAGGQTNPYIEIETENLTYKVPNIDSNGYVQSEVLPLAEENVAGVVKYAPYIYNQENGYDGGDGVVSASMVYSYVLEQLENVSPGGGGDGDVGTHNVSPNAHNDIRLLIQGLTTRLNALANSDDTTLDQMAEVVAYIKSNRTLIESVTTGKVNVSDIVNNLTTNVSNKPLSAEQGVVLNNLIDALSKTLSNHVSDEVAHITAAERTTWNAKPNIGDIPTKYSDLTDDIGYVKQTGFDGHKHNASDITAGTLSIERGGTGATTAEAARHNLGAAKEEHTHSLSDLTGLVEEYSGRHDSGNMKFAVANTTNFNNWVYTAKYIPALKMVFFRAYATTKVSMTADKKYEMFTITGDLAKPPLQSVPILVYNSGDACGDGVIGTNGKIEVKFPEGKASGVGTYISGFWFTA